MVFEYHHVRCGSNCVKCKQWVKVEIWQGVYLVFSYHCLLTNRKLNIGPMCNQDVMWSIALLQQKLKQFVTIFAFHLKVTPRQNNLRMKQGCEFSLQIYHLSLVWSFYSLHVNLVNEEKHKDPYEKVVFPCVFWIMPQCVFNKKDPIMIDVIANKTKVGNWNTSLCLHKLALILAKLCQGKSTINYLIFYTF
jgi:hypothetical protein